MKRKIAIAGASGFVGRWIIESMHQEYEILALSRKTAISTIRQNVIWRTTDLYSLTDTTAALKDVDVAIYLIHSMLPQTRLTQGSFEDMDLLLADNFRKAASRQNVKQIIYIGGIIPNDTSKLSKHLESRLEVEETLKQGDVPVTSIRASIVIGPGGSSFQLMRNLIQNLPVLICPKWTSNACQPVDIRELLAFLSITIGNSIYFNRSVNVGGTKAVTYFELMKKTAALLGLKRVWLGVPINGVSFSKWWVSKFSSTSYALVSPLIESLTHEMKISEKESDQWLGEISLESTLAHVQAAKLPAIPLRINTPEERNTVRSVQRMTAAQGWTAFSIGKYYPYWLQKKSFGLLRIRVEKKQVYTLRLVGIKILELSLIEERSNDDRLLYFITGGLLVKRREHGWLEFRSVLKGKFVMVALHEFVPTIPWTFYKYSQALLHLIVMKSFDRSINRSPEQSLTMNVF